MKFGSAITVVMLTVIMSSCTNKSGSGGLVVNGTIRNTTAKTIYLEEIPMATRERIIVDSAKLGDNGKYKLKAKAKEASVFILRLDQNTYPAGYVINDAAKITLNADADKQNQMQGQYEVQGSKASQKMKDFIDRFDTQVQNIRSLSRKADSLYKANAPDSVLNPLMTQHKAITDNAKQASLDALAASENPALSMFILGYYQQAARVPSYRLEGITNGEVKIVVDGLAKKYPDHNGLAAIKATLDQQFTQPEEEMSYGLVGKTAPEISLPDMNGKEVKLSSYRGKYVLVDFWASWCKPCRYENPTVVSAYNKFKDKNFTVLGVSLDKEKGAWVNAIKEDKLDWTHVSDLKYWGSPIVGLYGINGIPFNVLIDPQGKIVAEGLRGPALESKLGEVLQ